VESVQRKVESDVSPQRRSPFSAFRSPLTKMNGDSETKV
jgi:hypothetical protein